MTFTPAYRQIPTRLSMTKFSHSPNPGRCQRGFSLAELAIVLVIVALLIGGMLVPLSAQRDIQSTKETQKLMSEAKEALLGFAAANCRFPCPADPSTPSGTANSGIENPAGCATTQEGVFPWATLGLQETDAWGRRLTYRVTEDFAQPVANCTTGNAAFTLNSDGDISVLTATGGISLATKIPVILISHGKNGFGAYLPDGSQLDGSSDPNKLSPDDDEQENANSDTIFVSKTQTPTFDDLVDWISPNILKNRMISAGRLP